MLDKKVSDLLNAQVNKEFYSAYLYMDFSNYYFEQGLDDSATGIRYSIRRSATMRC
jgi:ferritin